MVILWTGDWQTSVSNLDRCKAVVDQLESELKRSKPPRYVVHLGDIKEATNPVDVRVSNFIIEAVQRLKRASDGFLFVRGNHDSIATHDGVPSCAPLVEVSGANVVASEDWLSVDLMARVSIWLVPYFRDPDRQRRAFLEAANMPRRGNTSLLAFHCEIDGCQRSAHSKGRGITLSDLGASKYDLCVGGHIHRHQQVAKNVWYAGSPYCCDWGEANEQKGFLKVTI